MENSWKSRLLPVEVCAEINRFRSKCCLHVILPSPCIQPYALDLHQRKGKLELVVPDVANFIDGLEPTNEEVPAKRPSAIEKKARSGPIYIRGVPWRLYFRKKGPELKASIRCKAAKGEEWNYRLTAVVTLHSPTPNLTNIESRGQETIHANSDTLSTADLSAKIMNYLWGDGSLRLSADLNASQDPYPVQ